MRGQYQSISGYDLRQVRSLLVRLIPLAIMCAASATAIIFLTWGRLEQSEYHLVPWVLIIILGAIARKWLVGFFTLCLSLVRTNESAIYFDDQYLICISPHFLKFKLSDIAQVSINEECTHLSFLMHDGSNKRIFTALFKETIETVLNRVRALV